MNISANALIELENVRKSFAIGDSEFVALKDLSLSLHKNDYIAITGPSGSGKSTLMNILGCLSKPDSGEYRFSGKTLSKANEVELAHFRNQAVGFVFQSFYLFARLSVFENVMYPLSLQRMSRQDRINKCTVIIERVGLGDKMNNLPGQLSGGQRQRVAIARALVTEPALLLGDEPTGNLDSQTSADIMALFDELHQRGQTIVLVTHEPDIARHCQRELYLVDGEIRGDCRPQGAT
ncbi:MAG: macrolide ABC transporter ATP-binding protein [Gammaproteobacteria bacterium]|nr:MAG: macrolide ABC transporter ATP-binding protein [Gammaproteobacteria bacterium]